MGAFGAGWQVRGWKAGNDATAALQAAWKAEAEQRDTANLEAMIYEQERGENDAATQAREVQLRTIYKTRVVSADCALDPAAVSLLTQAIATANQLASQSGSTMPSASPAP